MTEGLQPRRVAIAEWPPASPRFDHLERACGLFQNIVWEGDELVILGWMLVFARACYRYTLYINDVEVETVPATLREDTAAAIPHIPHARSGNFVFRIAPELLPALSRIVVVGSHAGRPIARLSTLYRTDIDDVVPIPSLEQMMRVSNVARPTPFRLWGIQAFGELMDAIGRHRDPRTVRRLLDWGCGVGRVTSHLINLADGIEVFGADIDPSAVQWCERHFSRGQFSTVAPLPPTPYDGAMFDAVVSFSVFTHLSREVQRAWLEEMRRIIAPGGVFVATVHGPSSAELFQPAIVHRLEAVGIVDEPMDAALDGVAPPGYYRTTFQGRSYTERVFGEYFEILEYVERVAAHQDLIVMRRRA